MTDAAVIARLSGDTFALLLAAPQTVGAVQSAGRRVREALKPPCMLDGLTLDLGASIGAALYPDHASDA